MLADSEVLSNSVIAEIVTELGVPTTVDDAYRTFMGKRLSEVIETIEAVIGRKLPPDFTDAYQHRTFDAFRARLKPVGGAREFLENPRDLARGAALHCLVVIARAAGVEP